MIWALSFGRDWIGYRALIERQAVHFHDEILLALLWYFPEAQLSRLSAIPFLSGLLQPCVDATLRSVERWVLLMSLFQARMDQNKW